MNENMENIGTQPSEADADRGGRAAERASFPACGEARDTELVRTRTPETLGAEVRNLTAAAKYLTVYYAVEIGRRLTEAKELVAHGEWMDWLQKETELSQSGANRLMRIYAEYGQKMGLGITAEANSSMLNNLSVSNALRLLAVPEEERETFAAEVGAEHISARELEAAIRERDEARKALQTSEARLADAQRTLSDSDKQLTDLRQRLAAAQEDVRIADDQATENERALKERIRELEEQPIDVAVQEPDPAEIERRAAEIAEARGVEAEKKVRRLETEKAAAEADRLAAEGKAKAEREKLKEKLKAAEEKLEAAKQAELTEERRAEVVAPYEAEIAKLKKQINMSEAKIANFTARFLLWQGAYNALMEALRDVPEESREKCRGAIRAQLENWKGAV